MSNPKKPARPLLPAVSLLLTTPAAGCAAAAIAVMPPLDLTPVPVVGGTWNGVMALVVFALPALLTLRKRGLVITFLWFALFFTLAAN